MSRVIVYTASSCIYCTLARRLLAKRDVRFEEVDVSHDLEARARLVRVTGRRSVPQIFIDGQPVGGYRELSRLARAGALDALRT